MSIGLVVWSKSIRVIDTSLGEERRTELQMEKMETSALVDKSSWRLAMKASTDANSRKGRRRCV